MIDIVGRKDQLLSRLADINARLARIEAELDAPQDSDWEERAVEREGDEVLETMGLTGQQEIRMIEAALQRIESGEYGLCMSCGVKISEERLDLLPFTPFCKACAK